jgi:hypothetical protein
MTDRELMQMALDAMESFESGTNGLYKGEFAEERKALRERLGQTEPMPVAWMFQHEGTGNVTFFDNPTMAKLFEKDNVRWSKAIPLYTQPTCQENRHVAENATPACKTHPDAPHGFDCDASHSAGRYVCECESWEPPPKREWVGFTHEELGWLDEALNLNRRFAVIEAIEAKLKQKNT